MYKIYINESLLVLCTVERFEKTEFKDHDLSFLYTGNRKRLHNVIDMLEKSTEKKKIIFYSNNLKALWKDFKSIHKKILACGGLVYNEFGEILAIHRKGYWDLPKGKIENKEGKKACAIREVEEECGVSDLTIIGKAGKTYHTHRIQGQKILKKSIWYFMETHKQVLTPQTKEEIDQAIWVSEEIFREQYDMYANIKALLDKVERKRNKKKIEQKIRILKDE